ncbi:MAG: putative lipid II flippase FtsW [Candidatus Paceibacterota bacterium]
MKKKKFNYILAGIVLLLIITGILVLSSASASASWEEFNNTSYFLRHQLLGLFIGLTMALLAFKIPLKLFKKYSLWLYVGALTLTGSIFLPFLGVRIGGSARWLQIGSFAFQPSELLKLGVILYFAFWLSQVKKNSKVPLIAFVVVLIPALVLLYLQPDTSTLVLILTITGLMYFAAETPWWHSLALTGVGVSGLFLLIAMAPYRMKRFMVFLKPGIDPMGVGYQLRQALIAIGSGGIFGRGLGLSRQKFGFLPHAMSDSIFAILGEEAGFIGGLTIIVLFLLFLWKSLDVAKKAPNQFAKLTAVGITSWITLQAFVNIGAMTGVLPLTGIPLPFISYGGSHLIAELIGIGILLNISKES